MISFNFNSPRKYNNLNLNPRKTITSMCVYILITNRTLDGNK